MNPEEESGRTLMNKKWLIILATACLSALPIFASPTAQTRSHPAITQPIPTSDALEKELQGLTWPQFKFVVQSVPKLKAKVDAYGLAGWKYVESRYRVYGWKKSIDKLDAQEKIALAKLIRQAQAGIR